jgi:hypothetical protein
MSKSSCWRAEKSVGKLNVNCDVDVWIVESNGLVGVAVVASAHTGKHSRVVAAELHAKSLE